MLQASLSSCAERAMRKTEKKKRHPLRGVPYLHPCPHFVSLPAWRFLSCHENICVIIVVEVVAALSLKMLVMCKYTVSVRLTLEGTHIICGTKR